MSFTRQSDMAHTSAENSGTLQSGQEEYLDAADSASPLRRMFAIQEPNSLRTADAYARQSLYLTSPLERLTHSLSITQEPLPQEGHNSQKILALATHDKPSHVEHTGHSTAKNYNDAPIPLHGYKPFTSRTDTDINQLSHAQLQKIGGTVPLSPDNFQARAELCTGPSASTDSLQILQAFGKSDYPGSTGDEGDSSLSWIPSDTRSSQPSIVSSKALLEEDVYLNPLSGAEDLDLLENQHYADNAAGGRQSFHNDSHANLIDAGDLIHHRRLTPDRHSYVSAHEPFAYTSFESSGDAMILSTAHKNAQDEAIPGSPSSCGSLQTPDSHNRVIDFTTAVPPFSSQAAAEGNKSGRSRAKSQVPPRMYRRAYGPALIVPDASFPEPVQDPSENPSLSASCEVHADVLQKDTKGSPYTNTHPAYSTNPNKVQGSGSPYDSPHNHISTASLSTHWHQQQSQLLKLSGTSQADLFKSSIAGDLNKHNFPRRTPSLVLSQAISKHRAQREASGLSTVGQYYVDPKTNKHYFVAASGRAGGCPAPSTALPVPEATNSEIGDLKKGHKDRRKRERKKLHKKEQGWKPTAVKAGPVMVPSQPLSNRLVHADASYHKSIEVIGAYDVPGTTVEGAQTTLMSPSHTSQPGSPRATYATTDQHPHQATLQYELNEVGSPRSPSYSLYSYYEYPSDTIPSSPAASNFGGLQSYIPPDSPCILPSADRFQPSFRNQKHNLSDARQSQNPNVTLAKAKSTIDQSVTTRDSIGRVQYLATPKTTMKGSTGTCFSDLDPQDPMVSLHMGIDAHENGDLEQSTTLFKDSAERGCGLGMLMYGLALRHGWGCESDPDTGFKYIRKAAEAVVQDLDSLVARDTLLNSSGLEEQATRSELVLSIYELGQCFLRGWGIGKDKKMALQYFQLAANLGDADAQFELGFCYSTGRGCKKDLKRAAQFYRKAEKQGLSSYGMQWIWKTKYDE